MLRNISEEPNDLIFKVEEDLYDGPNGNILVLHSTEHSIKMS